MAGEKRNVITKDRRRVLQEPGVIYTVRCPGTQCDCAHFGAECRRGFFSLWIQAVYGMCFAADLGIPCSINFDDKPYLYSHPEKYKGDLNFWNYYYLQPEGPGEKRIIPNRYIENYPLRIWNRSFFRKVNRTGVVDLVAKEDVQSYISQLTKNVKKQATLGVHIRRTDHYSEVEMIPMEQYLKVMEKQARKYDKFFISTDDNNVLDLMQKEFGKNRLIYQQAIRSNNEDPIHTNMQHKDRYRLGLEVLADCYTLSACQGAILTHSNVSYGSLLLNPNLPYNLLETSASQKSRQKTNFLYTLDRLGIRKM